MNGIDAAFPRFPHFPLSEFECRTGEPVPPELIVNLNRLRGMLEKIRKKWGGPLIPVSGYRSPAYNEGLYRASAERALREGRRPGVARDSAHITAEAADIRPADPRAVPLLHSVILGMYERGELRELGGLGAYPRWVHVDVRKLASGRLRRWGGTGAGQEPSLASNEWDDDPTVPLGVA